MSPEWRLLGSFEAANGMLMFGWSAAFIFEAMRRVSAHFFFKDT
jgi:hypothetical protein